MPQSETQPRPNGDLSTMVVPQLQEMRLRITTAARENGTRDPYSAREGRPSDVMQDRFLADIAEQELNGEGLVMAWIMAPLNSREVWLRSHMTTHHMIYDREAELFRRDSVRFLSVAALICRDNPDVYRGAIEAWKEAQEALGDKSQTN